MTRHLAVVAAVLLARASTAASLEGDVSDQPFALSFDDGTGVPVLTSASGVGVAGPAALSVRTADGWIHATAVATVRRTRAALRAVLRTDDAGGRTIALRMRSAGKGCRRGRGVLPGRCRRRRRMGRRVRCDARRTVLRTR